MAWIGVDFDGTLAKKAKPKPAIGEPVALMIRRVRQWLDEGREVRIVTARVAGYMHTEGTPEYREAMEQDVRITAWCSEHLGRALPVQAHKDPDMVELWDDRAVGVVTDEGVSVSEVQYTLGQIVGGSRPDIDSAQAHERTRSRVLHVLRQIEPTQLAAAPEQFVDAIIATVLG